jgi:CheY-like chemotaxis protein
MDRTDHILIVDDDAEIRSLLQRYLEKNGLRATAVAEGRAMWRRWTGPPSTSWCWT